MQNSTCILQQQINERTVRPNFTIFMYTTTFYLCNFLLLKYFVVVGLYLYSIRFCLLLQIHPIFRMMQHIVLYLRLWIECVHGLWIYAACCVTFLFYELRINVLLHKLPYCSVLTDFRNGQLFLKYLIFEWTRSKNCKSFNWFMQRINFHLSFFTYKSKIVHISLCK